MYAATAGIGAGLQKLEKFPGYQHERVLILAGLELKIAYNLLETRWKIWNSIFWNGSNAATKRSVNAKLESITFDAQTALIKAGILLNRYYDEYGILPKDKYLWSEIISCLNSSDRWIKEEFYFDSRSKQLKLPLTI
jgi:hypothetical protein